MHHIRVTQRRSGSHLALSLHLKCPRLVSLLILRGMSHSAIDEYFPFAGTHLAMELLEEVVVAPGEVDALLALAPHGGPQLPGQGVVAVLQLCQQVGADGDVVAPAPQQQLT